MYEAPDGPSRPCVGCRHSTGRCGEILQHEVQRCYLLKRAALVGGHSSPVTMFRLSGTGHKKTYFTAVVMGDPKHRDVQTTRTPARRMPLRSFASTASVAAVHTGGFCTIVASTSRIDLRRLILSSA
jgi:hypothetical protein